MRILGIDPGLHLTGYACVDAEGGEPALVEAGVVRLVARRSVASRLETLFEELGAILDELVPRVVAVEKLFAHYRHARTSIIMGHARGVVLLAVQRHGARLLELQATEVKKSITGNGHASKRQMQQAVMSQCGLAEPPDPPDVADALGIAICAARRITLGFEAVV